MKMLHKIFTRSILVAILLVECYAHNLSAQAFYTQTFGTGASFPAGWSSGDARIDVNAAASAQSSGYTSSSTTPQASGGNNVIFQDCAPNNTTLTLLCNNVVNTTGKSNIRVAFGRRETASFGIAVNFEWSSDGTSWNTISSDVSADNPNSTWETVFFDLPSGVNNVANLRFRFVFVTNTNNNCTAAPNFRIDDFTVGENATLPIALQSFTAQVQANAALLSFSTVSERDNAYFEIEHSTDALNFTSIGQVAGAGNSSEVKNYTFKDIAPTLGINYYRLKQVDFAGNMSFSTARSVKFGKTSGIVLYPVPAAETLHIQLEETFATDGQWQIIDLAGRIVATGILAGEQQIFEIPVYILSTGAYALRIISDQQVLNRQFSKQ